MELRIWSYIVDSVRRLGGGGGDRWGRRRRRASGRAGERASGRGKQRLLKALITFPFFDLSTAMWGAPFRRTPGTAAVVKRVVFSVVPLVIACHGSTEGSMGRSWFRLRANQATLARIVDEFVYIAT